MIPSTLTGAIIADTAARNGWIQVATERGVKFLRDTDTVEVTFTARGAVSNATLSRDGHTVARVAYRERDKEATVNRWLKAPKAPSEEILTRVPVLSAPEHTYTVTEVRSGETIKPADALVSVSGDLGVFRKVTRGPESDGPPMVLVSKGPNWTTPSLATDWTLKITHDATGATGGAGMPDHQHFEGAGSGARESVGPDGEITRHTSCGECGERFSFKTGQTEKRPVHRDGSIDERYRVSTTYNGHSDGPHSVAWFGNEYIGWSPDIDDAWAIARKHAAERQAAIARIGEGN